MPRGDKDIQVGNVFRSNFPLRVYSLHFVGLLTAWAQLLGEELCSTRAKLTRGPTWAGHWSDCTSESPRTTLTHSTREPLTKQGPDFSPVSCSNR